MGQALFVYGTLIFPKVMEAVCGEVPSSIAARLPGYRRYQVQDQIYPAVEPAPNDEVDGILYRDVAQSILKRLDRYEGREYRRLRLHVIHGRGAQAFAWVYLLRRPGCAGNTAQDWSAADFKSRHLGRWCRQLRRYHHHPKGI